LHFSLSVERYITNLIHEVPLPPPGRISVQYRLCDQVVQICRPPPNQLPMADVSALLLRCCVLCCVVLCWSIHGFDG
jgi:hypothetical protein